MAVTLTPVNQPLTGELTIPGDKSISHRAVMLGSLATGKTVIHNFLDGEDCLRTIENFKQLGVQIQQDKSNVVIESAGFRHFVEPKVPLYFGNSGTTARLMLGILSGLPFHTVAYGDPYLTVRPMDRVVTPLRQMGANIDGRETGKFLPIAIRGGNLQPITYEIPVKSAQVKSAILLAGIFAPGKTIVRELAKTRDHTENMLQAAGAEIDIDDLTVTITGGCEALKPLTITVPGDISSAAFFLVAALLVPNSKITLRQIGLNETRTGILDVLTAMGATVEVTNRQLSGGEPIGDITVRHQPLRGTTIDAPLIPRLIDELPIIALLATQAEGTTVIKDAEELRVKETDRIKATVEMLRTLGANIEETADGMIITGKAALTGGKIKSYGDHRMAMTGVIGSLICRNPVVIDDVSPIAISYPAFFDHLATLTKLTY